MICMIYSSSCCRARPACSEWTINQLGQVTNTNGHIFYTIHNMAAGNIPYISGIHSLSFPFARRINFQIRQSQYARRDLTNRV